MVPHSKPRFCVLSVLNLAFFPYDVTSDVTDKNINYGKAIYLRDVRHIPC